MFIYNEDKTITIKCTDGKFRTFALEDIDFDDYISTGELEQKPELSRAQDDFGNFC